jgi:hypothetical protein
MVRVKEWSAVGPTTVRYIKITQHRNNNNNNNNEKQSVWNEKAKVIPIIIGTTGSVSPSY